MGSVVKSGRLSSTTHALIGAGNMGGALLGGWLSGSEIIRLKPQEILVIDPAPGEAARRALSVGVKFSSKLTKGSASGLLLCLLAIKPQMFADVGPKLAKVLPMDTLIVSIMAGVSLTQLEQVFGTRPIIRAMPNLPAMFGAGITGFTGNGHITEAHKKLAQRSLQAGGEVVHVDSEDEIDMVTAISGSGPGYAFYFTEILAQSGIDLGLAPELSRKLARQSMIGAGTVLAKSDARSAELTQSVTSAGGTTEAALAVLSKGLPELMGKAVRAAYTRSITLGKF